MTKSEIFYDMYSDLANTLEEASTELGDKKAIDALIEALANAGLKDYDKATEYLAKSLQGVSTKGIWNKDVKKPLLDHYTIGLDEEWSSLGHDEVIACHLTRDEASKKIEEIARANVIRSYRLDEKKDAEFINQAAEHEAKKYYMLKEEVDDR